MKKAFFLIAIVLGLGLNAAAQNDTSPHHTLGSLDQYGKLELTAIYVDMVHKINMLIPYVPFNQKGDAVSLAGMGIPSSKDNNGFIKKLDASGGSHNEALDETLRNIIPYADKEDIIKSILFLQNVVEKIEAGI
ncbi:MAG TPA: hypothetical protein ENJ82_00410 [Bacteroidetes bacterium]|nr:hypothetical protein [Bacteroidota bacterium]